MASKKRRHCGFTPSSHICTPSSHIWTRILDKWSKFVGLEARHCVTTLRNEKGKKEYRFTTKNLLVSIIELNVQGANSETYLVNIHGHPQQGILKHFKPKNLGEDVDPKLEAEMQKYAKIHGLAPAVFASSEIAMISEKCQVRKQTHEQKCYKSAKGMSVELRQRANQLHTLFTSDQQRILQFCKNMYSKTGMFNTDPNTDNYMQMGTELVQIDYGANRFNNIESFELFFNQIGCFYPKEKAKTLLLNKTATYPPTYYWYKEIFRPESELPEEQRQNNEHDWSIILDSLRKENNIICRKLHKSYEEIKQRFGSDKTLERISASFHTYYLN